MANSCPVCQKDDMVQKASEIVLTRKIVESYHTSSTTNLPDELTLVLARLEEPKLSFGHRWGKYGYVIVSVLFIVIWVIIGLIVFTVLLVNVSIPRFLVYLGICGCMPILLALGLAILIFAVQSSLDKVNALEHAKEHPRWQKAIEIWDRLYFCHRDEIVFDPYSHAICELNNLHAFLFKVDDDIS